MSRLAAGDAVLAWPPKLEYDWPAMVADPALLSQELLSVVPGKPTGSVLVRFLGGKPTFARWAFVEYSKVSTLVDAQQLDELYIPQTGGNKKVRPGPTRWGS